jgi:hypothetical protein
MKQISQAKVNINHALPSFWLQGTCTSHVDLDATVIVCTRYISRTEKVYFHCFITCISHSESHATSNGLQSKHMELLIYHITWDLRRPLIYDATTLLRKWIFKIKNFFATKYFSLSTKFVTFIAKPLFFKENNVFEPFKEWKMIPKI